VCPHTPLEVQVYLPIPHQTKKMEGIGREFEGQVVHDHRHRIHLHTPPLGLVEVGRQVAHDPLQKQRNEDDDVKGQDPSPRDQVVRTAGENDLFPQVNGRGFPLADGPPLLAKILHEHVRPLRDGVGLRHHAVRRAPVLQDRKEAGPGGINVRPLTRKEV